MAITYDQLVTMVKDTIQSDGEATFEAHIDDFIKHAEDTIIKNCQIPPMTKKQTGNLVIGSPLITANSDFIAPLRLEFTDTDGSVVQAKHKDDSFTNGVFAGVPNDIPRYYSLSHSTTRQTTGGPRFRLRPFPDATYAYMLEYSARPASLTAGAGSDTTWISTNMQSALVYGTLMYAALYSLDLENSALYDRLFKEAMGLTKIEQEGKARDDRRRKDYIRPKVQEG